MTRRAALLCAALLLAAASAARAQQACPAISIECPDMVEAGGELTFRAVVAEADPSLALTFQWEVSVGTITSGQGTAVITVDTTGSVGRVFSASVTVGGLPEGCAGGEQACTTSWEEAPIARLVDSFGSLNAEAEHAHLDGFFDALQLEPGAQGYIVVYAGRRAREGEASKRGERARRYLVEEKSLEADRVVVLDGGHREEVSYELFIVPTGAMPPEPSPTVDVSEVEITREEKRRPARKPPANAPKTGGAKPNP